MNARWFADGAFMAALNAFLAGAGIMRGEIIGVVVGSVCAVLSIMYVVKMYRVARTA